jgi:hypothetical protein
VIADVRAGRLALRFGIAVAGVAALGGFGSRLAAAASEPPGITLAHDSLSFCIELHSGAREFQVRLRNRRSAETLVTVRVENGPRRTFVLRPTNRVQVVRGGWNGRHHAAGCRTTIAWSHSRIVVDLPLAQE